MTREALSSIFDIPSDIDSKLLDSPDDRSSNENPPDPAVAISPRIDPKSPTLPPHPLKGDPA